jgi:hypothetical protein
MYFSYCLLTSYENFDYLPLVFIFIFFHELLEGLMHSEI